MVKIRLTNFRYHLRNTVFISLAWIVSLLVMVLNRNYGLDYIIYGEKIELIPLQSLILVVVLCGIFLGITSSLFEFYFIGKKYMKLSHGVAILIKTVSYAILLLIVGISSYLAIDYLDIEFVYDNTLGEFLFSLEFLPMFLYMLFTSLFINILIHVERILGRGNLFRYVTGKYLKPVEEDRIFMFLDLNDSTALAEQWGHLKMSSFLQDFFSDLSEFIIPYRAGIYQFVGDEAVITWPLKRDKEQNADCIRLFYAFEEQISKRNSYYIENYGRMPEFKAGINCGTVVVSEVGTYKVELAYHGDVMNTTSRMTSQCRILERPLLVSEIMLQSMDLSGFSSESMGEAQFRGKETYTNLYYVFPEKNYPEE